ncbi:MAG: glycoside hydrolase family 5 protein [Spirochaetales bacterium]|nr:glycoside hydrolase family 5 protein [Spirochaetales bacterium]
MGNFLESEFEGKDTDGLLIRDEWFPLLKDAGFDFVRIPVRWSAHAGDSEPYPVDGAFAARVAHVADAALASGLSVVVNQHHYLELMENPAAHRARFLALARTMGRRFRGYPERLMIEILNEPTHHLTAGLWNDCLREAHAALRAENGSRVLIVGPTDWNNISGLASLSLAGLEADRKIVATFHYYEPHPFTHQGAPWVTPPHPTGRRWTGSDGELSALRADFDVAASWSARRKRPLLLGEFGAYQKHAAWPEVVAWTAAVRAEAEARGIPWCYWEFCHDFGVWDRDRKEFKQDLLRALIP